MKLENIFGAKDLKVFLDKYFSKLSMKYPDKKLIIFFDAIDQLDDGLEWVFRELPKNVKIVYSCSNANKNLTNKLIENLNSDNYIEIPRFSQNESKATLLYWLSMNKPKKINFSTVENS